MNARRLCLNVGQRNPLLCAKLNSESDPAEYIRNLLDDYCRDPSLFHKPNPVVEDVGTDFTPMRFNTLINSEEAWTVLSLEENMSEFVQRLIYLDIGRDPEEYLGEAGRKKRAEIRREKFLKEKSEKAAKKEQMAKYANPKEAAKFLKCFRNYLREFKSGELADGPSLDIILSAVDGFLSIYPLR